MGGKQTFLKNIGYVLLGAFFVSLSAVLVSQMLISGQIDSQIQTMFKLTEYPFS